MSTGSSSSVDWNCSGQEQDWWDPAEAMPRAELRRLQLERLRGTVEQASKVPFYREQLRTAGVTADHIQSLDDIRRLPFTTKDDLRKGYPLGFLAIPRSEVARYHGSSGTTGQPTFVAYSREDLNTWANLCARFLYAGGLRPEHTVHVAFGYGLFTGGFGLHYGIEEVGAAVIPAAAGNTRRQALILRDLQPETLVCTPSYALSIAEVCQEEGIDPHSLRLRYGHFGGEPWTVNMRHQIEANLGIEAFNNYGLSEIIGPGVSGECSEHEGMHVQEDHFIVECVDPDTLEPIEDGSYGELVFTTLTKEAMPIIRYRTRDIAALETCPCACGRTTVRMHRVVGRTDDMLIIRGVNVYPSQVEEALLRVEGAAPHYLIEIHRPGALDEATVKVEVLPQVFSDRMRDLQALRDSLEMAIEANTGVRMRVELAPEHTLERTAGKSQRVLDHRKLL